MTATPVATPVRTRCCVADQTEETATRLSLFAHQNGQWAKNIRGKLHYFGSWHDPEAAQKEYLDIREYLQAGRRPPDPNADGCRIAELCNRFLTAKQSLLNSRELSSLTFYDYHRSCELIIRQFGKDQLVDDLTAEDFETFRNVLAEDRGIVALGNEINRVRIVFKYGYDAGLIDRPVRFGPTFRRPTKKSLRIHRQRQQQLHGKRMFETDDLRRILKEATQPMCAMVLLGINGGLGATDVAEMPRTVLDLKSGWLDYPRRKTGIERRIPLWPETRAAVEDAIKRRSHDRLVFVTREGNPYLRVLKNGAIRNSITEEFAKLLKRLKIKRPTLSFYALRHTFETIAGESRDQVAVDAIMGHVDQSMAAAYREQISNDRLTNVVNTVRGWLFPRGKAISHKRANS